MREKSAQYLNLAALPIPFVCECENERSTQVVRPKARNTSVRRNGTHFFMSLGHQSEPDRVVAKRNAETTVEKTGEEGRLVAERDPR